MDKDLKKLIGETIDGFATADPEKLIERSIHEIQRDICPHCKKQINEHCEYTEDGGVTWRHSDCKKLIARPKTPIEDVSTWLRPYVSEAHNQRHEARKVLGMESITQGFAPNDATEKSELPPSGHEKYDKQQPGGTMSAVNTSGLEEEYQTSEQEESNPVGVRDYVKFKNMPINIVNTSKNPINVTITEITVAVDKTNGKSAYIIRINDELPAA